MANIYLDYNATAPMLPEVAEAITSLYGQPLNASSVHAYGRKAKKILEDARKKVSDLVSVNNACGREAQVIFTASGTEANNLALKGVANVTRIVSAIEHPSVLATAKQIDDKCLVAPVDRQGIIKLDALERLLRQVEGKALISVMLANNEIGVIQPIESITTLAKEYGALVHMDAVQAIGRIPVDMYALDVDMLTISAHKIGGGQGAAALVVKKHIPLKSQTIGGGQELGFRAGTENLAAIHGFGVAAEKATEQLKYVASIKKLRDDFEQKIIQAAPDATIVSQEAMRLINTSCVIMPAVKSETQLINFDLEGIAVSAGSACSSGKVDASHVLLAMGYAKEEAICALRVSIGKDTTAAELNKLADAWIKLYNRIAAQPEKVA